MNLKTAIKLVVLYPQMIECNGIDPQFFAQFVYGILAEEGW